MAGAINFSLTPYSTYHYYPKSQRFGIGTNLHKSTEDGLHIRRPQTCVKLLASSSLSPQKQYKCWFANVEHFLTPYVLCTSNMESQNNNQRQEDSDLSGDPSIHLLGAHPLELDVELAERPPKFVVLHLAQRLGGVAVRFGLDRSPADRRHSRGVPEPV